MHAGLKTSFTDPEARHSAGRFGMTLFLISLAVLFVATALGLVIVRVQLTQRGHWPADLPALPWTMALGTLVLVASSVSMQRALNLARAGSTGPGAAPAFRRAMAMTTALGVGFLVIQCVGWLTWLSVVRERWSASDEFRLALTAFYVLTGLHGLHVVGGLVGLLRTLRGDGDPMSDADERRDRAQYCAMYWHFLGVVWLALYGLLLIWS